MKLVSFDIFDTTLIRRCGQPEGVWKRMGDLLYDGKLDVAQAFYTWRKQACGETLSEIYALMDSSFANLAHKDASYFPLLECEVEKSMLIANPLVKNIIEKKRNEGVQIAFISDMYLDSLFLKQILVEQGCAKEEDLVYVSCEHHARKDNGSLFEIVLRELHPKKWEHYGDNIQSDIKMAGRKRIKAIFVDTMFTKSEKAYQTISPQLAAFTRLYRLEHINDSYSSFASNFVVPAYLPYANFVLEEARRMGIKRLYFLSRDSYILREAARALTNNQKDIQLHYLFVSRRALLLPFLYGGDEKTYLSICDHHSLINSDDVDKRLRHLGTSREELCCNFGIDFFYSRIKNTQEQDDFLQKIFHSSYTPVLQQRAKKQHDLLIEYFQQEGLCDGISCAAVDVGWLGTSRLMINHILRSSKKEDVHFFYYGIRNDVFPPSAGRYTSYFQSEEIPLELTALLEHYYSASPYPSTIGYHRGNDGTIEPSFDGGKGFCHTSISKANIEAMKCQAALFPHSNDTQLRLWAKKSFDCILNPCMDVDISALLTSGNFDDNEPLVKVLNILEILNIVFFGGKVTCFDLGSLRLTIPKYILPVAWRCHKKSSELRYALYKKMKKISNVIHLF